MANQLGHGGYGQEAPDGIHQLKYAGGGHPGCGGFIEALEIESGAGPVFLLHEHASDSAGQRWRWREFDDGGKLLDAFERLWGSRNREGFSPWFAKPYWEIVNYNNWQSMKP